MSDQSNPQQQTFEQFAFMRETIAILNALCRAFNPSAPALTNDATDHEIIAFAGGIAAVSDRMAGGVRISTVVPSAIDARSNFGAMLSLQLGLPFSIQITDTFDTSSAALELYARHRTDYERWLSDKNTIAQGGNQDALHFSDAYLQARKDFARAMAQANTAEVAPLGGISTMRDLGVSQNIWFEDGLTDQKVKMLGSTPLAPARKVLFGSHAEDANLTGAEGEDQIFGLAGNDSLIGQGGADHLEGGAGNDILSGGAGNDTLMGGQGHDVYLLDGSAGADILLDPDGGEIRYLDQVLTGGKESSPGSREWQQGSVSYRLVDEGEAQHLLISAGAGTVLVKNWRNGQLGITLDDAADTPKPAPSDLVVNGDRARVDHDAEAEGVQMRWDALGNLIVRTACAKNDRMGAPMKRKKRFARTGRRPRLRRWLCACALLGASVWAIAQDAQPPGWELVAVEGQAMPVPKVWLETEEGRIAHSLKLPDIVPKPPPYDFKQPLLEKLWFKAHRKAAVRYFDHLCATEAGQWIVRTAPNVDGFYFARPQGNRPARLLMAERWAPENPWMERLLVSNGSDPLRAAWTFVYPPFMQYDYIEQPRRDLPWQKNVTTPYIRLFGYTTKNARHVDGHLTTHLVENTPMQVKDVERLQSRYGFTWRGIKRPQDREHGIAGGEMLIYDVQTKNVLAVRRQFAISLSARPGDSAAWDIAATCPQLNGRNQRSSEFKEFALATITSTKPSKSGRKQ